jgi:hypothetical protein
MTSSATALTLISERIGRCTRLATTILLIMGNQQLALSNQHSVLVADCSIRLTGKPLGLYFAYQRAEHSFPSITPLFNS